MKAVDFIKKFGWDYTVNYADYAVNINDLKQYIDAWELVELKGGLYQAKKHYLDMREAINQVYYSHSCEFESQELKQAIELVESVNGNQVF